MSNYYEDSYDGSHAEKVRLSNPIIKWARGDKQNKKSGRFFVLKDDVKTEIDEKIFTAGEFVHEKETEIGYYANVLHCAVIKWRYGWPLNNQGNAESKIQIISFIKELNNIFQLTFLSMMSSSAKEIMESAPLNFLRHAKVAKFDALNEKQTEAKQPLLKIEEVPNPPLYLFYLKLASKYENKQFVFETVGKAGKTNYITPLAWYNKLPNNPSKDDVKKWINAYYVGNETAKKIAEYYPDTLEWAEEWKKYKKESNKQNTNEVTTPDDDDISFPPPPNENNDDLPY